MFRHRWLETVRAKVEQEPRRKGRRGKAEAVAFRQAMRGAVELCPSWPRPRAALALDLTFVTSRQQAPGLWNLPKNYLDLLGATSAPAADPGPVIFRDDRQVKMLFASCMHGWKEDGTASPAIHVQARTRTSAIADMELAGELLEEFGDELVDNAPWASYDPDDPSETADERWYQPSNVLAYDKFHERERLQAYFLDQTDRMLRNVFFESGRWLLTGQDLDMRRLERLWQSTGAATIEDLRARQDQINLRYRKLLNTAVSIELPPLPLRQGDSAVFSQGVHQACRSYVDRFPIMTPLVAPVRVTVLAVQPRRHVKDLDNILITVLQIMEEQLKPHAEPWLLSPSLTGEPNPQREESLARLRRIGGSNTWAYQVLELHRSPIDCDEGSLILIPGLGWNRHSVWSEAEQLVEQGLEKLTGR